MEEQIDSIFLDVMVPVWQTDTAAVVEVPALVSDLDSALAAPTLAVPVQTVEIVETAPAWTTGLSGDSREVGMGAHSGILALLTAVVLMLMLSYNNCRRILRNMAHELWGMRKRENAFDERTSNETRTLVMLAVQECVSIGILLFCALQPHIAIAPFTAVLLLIGLAGAYYLAQRCTYYIVGYTFTTAVGRRYFVEGFTASQAFLGLALLVPSMVAIFYPQTAWLMVQIGTVMYVAARIVFISKGFRIFYQNFGSLLYFILYLCTLEIIPPIFVYLFALNLVSQTTV